MEKVLQVSHFAARDEEDEREMLLAFSILQRTRFPLSTPSPRPSPILLFLLPRIPLSSFEMRKLLNTKNQEAPRQRELALCTSSWMEPSPQIRRIRRISNEKSLVRLNTRDEIGIRMFACLEYNFNEHN